MTTLVLGSYVHANLLQVPSLPDSGQSLLAERYWSEHGGKGLNVGVALKRLGGETALLLPVGNDLAGRLITEDLRQQGFDTGWVVACAERSGYGVGLIGTGGDNVIAVFPGANQHLDSQIALDALQRTQPSTVYAQLEIAPATVGAVFSAARRSGIRTVLNPSPWQPVAALLPLTDLLIVNASEAAALFGLESARVPRSPEDWLQALPELAGNIGWQGDWLIVTLDAQGCVAMGRDELILQPAWSIAARDATGAGDAFSGGLLWALDRHAPEHVLSIANACGAYIAERHGVWAHLPDGNALHRWMAERPRPAGRSIKRTF